MGSVLLVTDATAQVMHEQIFNLTVAKHHYATSINVAGKLLTASPSDWTLREPGDLNRLDSLLLQADRDSNSSSQCERARCQFLGRRTEYHHHRQHRGLFLLTMHGPFASRTGSADDQRNQVLL